MRLLENEKSAIKDSFDSTFLPEDKLYIFGSRIDETKKGGDIDLFIKLSKELPEIEKLNKKIEFLNKIYTKIGEQKIDIIFSSLQVKSIEKEALSKGILL